MGDTAVAVGTTMRSLLCIGKIAVFRLLVCNNTCPDVVGGTAEMGVQLIDAAELPPDAEVAKLAFNRDGTAGSFDKTET